MTDDYSINVPGKYNVRVFGIPDTPWGNTYAKVETPMMKYSKRACARPDIFTSLGSVSKGAYRLFLALMSKTNPYTNFCVYPTRSYTKSQKSSYNRSLRELIRLKIYRRIRPDGDKIEPDTVMLNPYMFFANGDLGKARQNWDNLQPYQHHASIVSPVKHLECKDLFK